MIDSTIVKAHRSAGGAIGGVRAHAIGRGKGGRTSNNYAVTDGQGRPIAPAVKPGITSDYTPIEVCIGAVPPARHLIADKGYDSSAPRDWFR
jgi:hypothetical protein